MKITSTLSYAGSLDQALSVLVSEELAHARAAAYGGAQAQSAMTFEDLGGEGAQARRRIKVTVPSEELPSALRAFFKRGINAEVTITASPSAVIHDVRVAGVPVKGTVTISLTADPSNAAQTSARFEADVAVNIPFVGAKIEKEAARVSDKYLARDTRLVNSLLGA